MTFDEMMKHVNNIVKQIDAKIKAGDCLRSTNGDPYGTINCPVCGSKIEFFRCDSYNGHRRLRCSTPNCINITE